ncbi:MAG: PRC-barrel domain-containing protein [Pseudolabrys sp.]
MNRRAAIGLAMMAPVALLQAPLSAAFGAGSVVLAQQDQSKDDSPEAKMARRFPQKVQVGHLIGLPVLDDDDLTLGLIQKVVRTPAGKIQLIVLYSKWFGWFGRPVAVPIEVVTILANQLDSVDMPREDYASAPTWTQGKDTVLGTDDIIRVALGRR